jgi:hypothetical protein
MTQTQTPPAGWYPDPAGSGGQRWWNGMAWSDHVQPAVAASVPTHSPVAAQQPQPQAEAQATVVPETLATTTALQGVSEAQYTPMGADIVPGASSTPGAMPHSWAMNTSMAGSRSDNQFAYVAFGFSAFYILLAIMTHFVLIGVVPVLMAVRSLKAQEKLAPYAMGVAILTVVVSFVTLSGH